VCPTRFIVYKQTNKQKQTRKQENKQTRAIEKEEGGDDYQGSTRRFPQQMCQ
jgi:hypothetical protein